MKPVRFSNLKWMALSPAHYFHHLNVKERSKRQFDVGTAAHSMVLGGVKSVVYEGIRNPRAKAYQEFLAKVEADYPGALVLSPSENAAATGCANSIRRHRGAMALLEGRHEVELPTWDIAGRECGGRPDVVNDEWICELKTTVSSHPGRFVWLGLKMHYAGQIDWYLQGNEATGGKARAAHIVAVESSPPYVVQCFEVTPEALEAGRKAYMQWFEDLRRCEESNHWPGYQQCSAVFDVPEDREEIAFKFAEDTDDDEEDESEAA